MACHLEQVANAIREILGRLDQAGRVPEVAASEGRVMSEQNLPPPPSPTEPPNPPTEVEQAAEQTWDALEPHMAAMRANPGTWQQVTRETTDEGRGAVTAMLHGRGFETRFDAEQRAVYARLPQPLEAPRKRSWRETLSAGRDRLPAQRAAEPPKVSTRKLSPDGWWWWDESTQSWQPRLLQDRINAYVALGYRVISQTDTAATLLKPKTFSFFWFLVSLLFCIFPGIIYLGWYLGKKDTTIHLVSPHAPASA